MRIRYYVYNNSNYNEDIFDSYEDAVMFIENYTGPAYSLRIEKKWLMK